jgi:hypothetical protein
MPSNERSPEQARGPGNAFIASLVDEPSVLEERSQLVAATSETQALRAVLGLRPNRDPERELLEARCIAAVDRGLRQWERDKERFDEWHRAFNERHGIAS